MRFPVPCLEMRRAWSRLQKELELSHLMFPRWIALDQEECSELFLSEKRRELSLLLSDARCRVYLEDEFFVLELPSQLDMQLW